LENRAPGQEPLGKTAPKHTQPKPPTPPTHPNPPSKPQNCEKAKDEKVVKRHVSVSTGVLQIACRKWGQNQKTLKLHGSERKKKRDDFIRENAVKQTPMKKKELGGKGSHNIAERTRKETKIRGNAREN